MKILRMILSDISRFLRWEFKCYLYGHEMTLKTDAEGWLYCECIHCLRTTEGILTGERNRC